MATHRHKLSRILQELEGKQIKAISTTDSSLNIYTTDGFHFSFEVSAMECSICGMDYESTVELTQEDWSKINEKDGSVPAQVPVEFEEDEESYWLGD